MMVLCKHANVTYNGKEIISNMQSINHPFLMFLLLSVVRLKRHTLDFCFLSYNINKEH